MSRRKSDAANAPTTIAEATALANRYAQLSADIAAIEAERAVRRAEVDKDCDARIATRKDEMNPMFESLRIWWAGAGSKIDAARKSAAIGAVTLGLRTSTPKLKLVEGKEADAIAWLLDPTRPAQDEFSKFVRTKHTLDKPALLAALTNKAWDWAILGRRFKRTQKDEFFIAPIAERDGITEQVAP